MKTDMHVRRLTTTRCFAILLPVLIPLQVSAVCSTPPLIWSRGFDGATHYHDLANAVATDVSGNVIVVGSYREVYTNRDVLVRKYDPAGSLLWSRSWTHGGIWDANDEAHAVAVDSTGNIIVAGRAYSLDTEWLVIKYDASGNTLWTTIYIDTPCGVTQANGIAIDKRDDSIITVGYENRCADGQIGNFQTNNLHIRKYSAGGALMWTTSFVDTTGINGICGSCFVSSYANAVASYPNGDFVVAGSTTSNYSLLVRRYDSAANLLWSRTLTRAPNNNDDQAYGVAVDADGNIAVVGYETPTDLGRFDKDWIVHKYSGAGDLMWTRSYNSPGDGFDTATAVVIDSHNNIIVVGVDDRSFDVPNQSGNWMIRAYDPAGLILWSMSYDNPASSDDGSTGVAIDGMDQLLVAGYEYRPDLSQGYNWLLRKYGCPAPPPTPTVVPPAIGPQPGQVWVTSTAGLIPVHLGRGESLRILLNPPEPGLVSITAYSLLWESVATLTESAVPAGPLEIRWDGRNRDGSRVATGTYLIRIAQPGTKPILKRITVVR